MFFVNSDGKSTGGCMFLVLLLLLYRAISIQFTSKYQGKTVTGLVGSSVNFTWTFSGNVYAIEWGIKKDGANALNTSSRLVLLHMSGLAFVPVRPPYAGRVSGTRHGDSSSAQAVFTLGLVRKEDENVYGCRITGGFIRTSDFDYVQLVVEEAPRFTHPTQPNASYNDGSAVDISCTAQGTPDADVRWIYNGQEKSSGSKTAHLIFSPISKVDAGTYTCRANNSAGIKEKQLDIFVNFPANIEFLTPNLTVNERDAIDLRCDVSGYPAPNISWKKDGKQIKPTGKELYISISKRSDTGAYVCTADNSVGQAVHKKTFVVVNFCEDNPSYAEGPDGCAAQAEVNNYCNDYYDFMSENCAMSCGFCSEEP